MSNEHASFRDWYMIIGYCLTVSLGMESMLVVNIKSITTARFIDKATGVLYCAGFVIQHCVVLGTLTIERGTRHKEAKKMKQRPEFIEYMNDLKDDGDRALDSIGAEDTLGIQV